MSPSHDAPNRAIVALSVVLALVAVARIVATYPVFSHTFDEPAHLATGLEWLSRGTYQLEFHTPPLARIAVALGPWLAGAESLGERAMWIEARRIMDGGAGYYQNLMLARLGIIPAFLLACAMLWRYARRVGGIPVAVAALALFTVLPPILANAGVATTDMPFTGAYLALLVAFPWWIDRPRSRTRGAILGLAFAVALCTKLSALPFFGITAALMLAARAFDRRRSPSATTDAIDSERDRVPTQGIAAINRQAVEALLIAFIVAAAFCWTIYRFSLGLVGGFLLPAPELFLGIAQVAEHNAQGHATYLLGQAATEGRWAFFPVALGVKTPIAFLVLAAVGGILLVRQWWRTSQTTLLDPIIAATAILGSAMAANINLGVRHVLPIYPLLAVLAGYAVLEFWRSRRAAQRAVTVGLSAWLVVASVRAHPDYLAAFNELAGREPGRILVDSDLDWGQDAERLAEEVKRRGITSLALAFFGSGDHVFRIVPAARPLRAKERATGWVAISETNYQRGAVSLTNGVWRVYPDAYAWLRAYPPVARIGKTIRLYRIDEAPR